MSPGKEQTAPVLMVRYRAGVVGETRRTVHAVALHPANADTATQVVTR